MVKRILLMMIVLFSSISLSAEESHGSSSSAGSVRLTCLGKGSIKKRMPSRTNIDVVYQDGVLTISSDFYEGEFSLSFENCESGESYEIPSIYVGESVPFELNVGEYQVDAIGVDGTVLSGVMDVQ